MLAGGTNLKPRFRAPQARQAARQASGPQWRTLPGPPSPPAVAGAQAGSSQQPEEPHRASRGRWLRVRRSGMPPASLRLGLGFGARALIADALAGPRPRPAGRRAATQRQSHPKVRMRRVTSDMKCVPKNEQPQLQWAHTRGAFKFASQDIDSVNNSTCIAKPDRTCRSDHG